MSNVALFASLPSVQEILLVESTSVGAEMLRRNIDGNWPPDAVPVDPKVGVYIRELRSVSPVPGHLLADQLRKRGQSGDRGMNDTQRDWPFVA